VQHRARQRDRDVELEVPAVIPGECGDPLAGADPEADQRPGHPYDPGVVLAVGVAVHLRTDAVLDDLPLPEEGPRPVEEPSDQEWTAHPATTASAANRSRTCGMTLVARISIRSDPLSTDSPGSCAQKWTSLI